MCLLAWPVSRFGQLMLTRVQPIVHLSYPCGTSLVPPPPSCWQIPTDPHGNGRHEVGNIVRRASHMAVASHACRRGLLLIAQQVMAGRSQHDKAKRDFRRSRTRCCPSPDVVNVPYRRRHTTPSRSPSTKPLEAFRYGTRTNFAGLDPTGISACDPVQGPDLL